MRAATTRPYMAIIPAMTFYTTGLVGKLDIGSVELTTGMMDFMIKSGLMTDMAAIPVPDLAVPYAAPRAESAIADAAPMHPKNGP